MHLNHDRDKFPTHQMRTFPRMCPLEEKNHLHTAQAGNTAGLLQRWRWTPHMDLLNVSLLHLSILRLDSGLPLSQAGSVPSSSDWPVFLPLPHKAASVTSLQQDKGCSDPVSYCLPSVLRACPQPTFFLASSFCLRMCVCVHVCMYMHVCTSVHASMGACVCVSLSFLSSHPSFETGSHAAHILLKTD